MTRWIAGRGRRVPGWLVPVLLAFAGLPVLHAVHPGHAGHAAPHAEAGSEPRGHDGAEQAAHSVHTGFPEEVAGHEDGHPPESGDADPAGPSAHELLSCDCLVCSVLQVPVIPPGMPEGDAGGRTAGPPPRARAVLLPEPPAWRLPIPRGPPGPHG